MASQTQKPRDMFRWAFEEQLRTRLWKSDMDSRIRQMVEAGAIDAFDYTLRRYGLDLLDIRPGRE